MMYLHASMYSVASALGHGSLGCKKSLSIMFCSRGLSGVFGCRANVSRALPRAWFGVWGPGRPFGPSLLERVRVPAWARDGCVGGLGLVASPVIPLDVAFRVYLFALALLLPGFLDSVCYPQLGR